MHAIDVKFGPPGKTLPPPMISQAGYDLRYFYLAGKTAQNMSASRTPPSAQELQFAQHCYQRQTMMIRIGAFHIASLRQRPCTWQRCTGAGVSEWAPAGVLTIFENRSGARVDFSKEGQEPEWAGVSFSMRC